MDPPPGFVESERQLYGEATPPAGIQVTYSDRSGRLLLVWSGVGGGIGGAPTGRSAVVRGHEARILREQDGSWLALWYEASLDEECNQYLVSATDMTVEEFLGILGAVH